MDVLEYQRAANGADLVPANVIDVKEQEVVKITSKSE